MDINRSKLVIVSLFMITICFWPLPLSVHADSRSISVISDLSHQSGKLGAYRALIIGINDYKDPKIPDLKTAVKDANAMANLLSKRYGFEVKLLLDRKATKEAIYRTLRSLVSSTKADDSVLIYYAGHGDLDRTYDDGWWIPADAKGGNPITYLDNGQVQKAMRSMKARHVLLISDSCYSGTLFGQARAMPPIIDEKYYLNLYIEKSRWGMTSGNKTPVSDRGSGGHSVFAYQLLKELRKNAKPFVSIQEIYTRIAPIVGNNSEQTPLCRPIRNTGDQGGEFVFVATTGTPSSLASPGKIELSLPAPSKQQAKESSYELLFWESIKNSKNEKMFEAYLKQFPNGAFVQLARINIMQYKTESIPEKKVESIEQKPVALASIEPNSNDAEIIAKEGQYVKYKNGIVYDKNTGLEWVAGPDKTTYGNDVKKWVSKLDLDGGGWRMPSKEELKALYKKGLGTRNMTPLLVTKGWTIYSKGTLDSMDIKAFNFARGSSFSFRYYNLANTNDGHEYRSGGRGFAVRSRRQ